MCDAATQTLIRQVVDEKVNANEMFTAFDVSLAVKPLCKKDGLEEPRHRFIKNDIHQEVYQYVSMGIYQSQPWDVGAPEKAILYYPTGSDPNAYIPRPRNASQAIAATPAMAFTVAVNTLSAPAAIPKITSPAPTDASDVGRVPDARGTVCVPNFLLRTAGYKQGDTVYVLSEMVSGKSAVVLTKSPANGSITTYTVDCNDNVRVTKATLAQAGIADRTYDFRSESDKVFILAH